MKVPYPILIALATLIEITLLFISDFEMTTYGPVMFWSIGLIGMLNYMLIMFSIAASVKSTKPDLFKKFSVFGIMLTRNSLTDHEFLNSLNENEDQLLKRSKTISRYFFICFILFAVSGILTVLT